MALTEASEKFGKAFYYRLARYVEWMVRPPDRYTFKKHYIMCLPKGIFDYLLSKEVTADHSRMESILHHARRAEKGINQTAIWYDTRRTMRAERLTQRMENVPRKYTNQQEMSAKEIERKPERIPN